MQTDADRTNKQTNVDEDVRAILRKCVDLSSAVEYRNAQVYAESRQNLRRCINLLIDVLAKVRND